MPDKNKDLQKTTALLNCTAFLMGFCSICYELIIATQLSRIFFEGIFVYPGCLALFIFCMGAGASRWHQKSKELENISIHLLIKTEFILTLLGLLSIFLINIPTESAIYFGSTLNSVIIGFMLSAIIGYFSGQELPLLFHFCSHIHSSQKHIRRIIFFDYCASFAASVACSLIFFSYLGIFKTSIIVSFINLLIIILILYICYKTRITYSRKVYPLVVCALSVFFIVLSNLDSIENSMLKRYLLGKRQAVLLEKLNTKYQEVLLFLMRKDYRPIKTSEKEVLSNPKDYFLFAVLNGSLQFFEPLDSKTDADHTYLFDPFMTVFDNQFADVLILGGGDGLPARQAVKYKEIKNITVVDIDQEWVEFSKSNPYMKLYNNASFHDPRLKIYYDDAFKWVIKTRKKFDLIIVDFPSEPNSLAAIRTVSLQFLRDLKRITTDRGIVVLYNNGTSLPLLMQLISKTAQEAGFSPAFGYRQESDTWTAMQELVLFNSEKMKKEFYEGYAVKYFDNDDKFNNIINVFGFMHYGDVTPAPYGISFYDPFVSRLSLKDKFTLFFKDPDG